MTKRGSHKPKRSEATDNRAKGSPIVKPTEEDRQRLRGTFVILNPARSPLLPPPSKLKEPEEEAEPGAAIT